MVVDKETMYVYKGDKLTDPDLINKICFPVKRPDNKCIRSKKSTMLVHFPGVGDKVVLARSLRKVPVNQILVGNWMEKAKKIPDGTIQCCVTSPPYWGQRDYDINPTLWGGKKKCDHQFGDDGFCDKCNGWLGAYGLEPTPELYVKHTVMIFQEVWRCLADDGTFWLNIGDTYWGGKGRSGEESKESAEQREKQGKSYKHSVKKVSKKGSMRPQDRNHEFIKPKDLVGIPWMVAFALRNAGWYLRSEIIWNKKNPMPESINDRPTRSHEQIFLLTKSKYYYYDADAIREKSSPNTHSRVSKAEAARVTKERKEGSKSNTGRKINYKVNTRESGSKSNENYHQSMVLSPETRNKRDVWHVETNQFGKTHIASFPGKLISPCILAGSREGDLILDPFGGSGTTAEIALKYGRKFVICEISEAYVESDLKPSIQRALSTPKLIY